jgi:hypothetical protein
MKQEKYAQFRGKIHEQLPLGTPRRTEMININGFYPVRCRGAYWIEVPQGVVAQSRPTFQNKSDTLVEKSSLHQVYVAFLHFLLHFSHFPHHLANQNRLY